MNTEPVKVVGVQHSNYKKATSEFEVGMPCELTWIKDNKYDKYAVTVTCNGIRIGYLGKDTDEQLQVVAGNCNEGILASYSPEKEPWQMFTVTLTPKEAV